MTGTMIRRVENHLGTVITLAAHDASSDVVDRFFGRIRELESLLSRFRTDSQISQIANGALDLEGTDPSVLEVLTRCVDLRHRTDGFFEHEPRRRSGDLADPVLDPNAVAKGWIVEEAAAVLRDAGVTEFFINAGGDVLANRSRSGGPWRVGIQHPDDQSAVFAVFEVFSGAVATSGTYERGQHIRFAAGHELRSVTVVGPDLAEADGLATAVYAAGQLSPPWWSGIDPAYGLLIMSVDGRLRWRPPLFADAASNDPIGPITLVSGF